MLNPYQKLKVKNKFSHINEHHNFNHPEKPNIIKVYEKVNTYPGRLRQSGRATITSCPFHSDNKPSFAMYEDNNSFYCFSCGAKGDSYSLIQQVLGLTFSEALEFAKTI